MLEVPPNVSGACIFTIPSSALLGGVFFNPIALESILYLLPDGLSAKPGPMRLERRCYPGSAVLHKRIQLTDRHVCIIRAGLVN